MKRFSSLFQARVGGVLLKTLLLIFGFVGLSPALADTPGTFTSTGSMSQARRSHSVTLLPNGKILVAGGETSGGRLASAALYDPQTSAWSATGSLSPERAGHTATLLPTGKILAAGGTSNSGNLASAQLYDPQTGTWSNTGSLAENRRAYDATLLPNGKVLVAGGLLISLDWYAPRRSSMIPRRELGARRAAWPRAAPLTKWYSCPTARCWSQEE